ncbi:MAG TPA: hypothetical protein VM677_35085 [Actinokineospora sp.]|nr:hypothetical protein [Actinokineospora sp.]
MESLTSRVGPLLVGAAYALVWWSMWSVVEGPDGYDKSVVAWLPDAWWVGPLVLAVVAVGAYCWVPLLRRVKTGDPVAERCASLLVVMALLWWVGPLAWLAGKARA